MHSLLSHESLLLYASLRSHDYQLMHSLMSHESLFLCITAESWFPVYAFTVESWISVIMHHRGVMIPSLCIHCWVMNSCYYASLWSHDSQFMHHCWVINPCLCIYALLESFWMTRNQGSLEFPLNISAKIRKKGGRGSYSLMKKSKVYTIIRISL